MCLHDDFLCQGKIRTIYCNRHKKKEERNCTVLKSLQIRKNTNACRIIFQHALVGTSKHSKCKSRTNLTYYFDYLFTVHVKLSFDMHFSTISNSQLKYNCSVSFMEQVKIQSKS